MRLIQYLNESKVIVKDFEALRKNEKQVVKLIEGNCKPFLKEFSNPLYRGVKTGKEMFIKKDRRKDRKPKDMPPVLHELLDEVFHDIFGWYVRSEGVFVSNEKKFASSYGFPYFFFPIGKYRYVYSPEVRDLYITTRDEVFHRVRYDIEAGQEVTQRKYDIVEKAVKELYTNKKLNFMMDARKTGMEVQFDCNSYYMLYSPDPYDTEKDFMYSIVQELGFDVR